MQDRNTDRNSTWRGLLTRLVIVCATIFVYPLHAQAQISPIWTWQSNQPTAILTPFLGRLYAIKGQTLLLGGLYFREDEWRACPLSRQIVRRR
jgi:hypothetical protein